MVPGRFENSFTSTDLKNIPIPDEIQCCECRRVKPKSQFSNKQLNDLRFKISTGISVNTKTAYLRCRVCTGDQTHELLCNGPCRSIQGLDGFSKNQRRTPEIAWCISCTQWKEAMEPGVATLPPPNNELSPDEERALRESEVRGYEDHDPEGDPDTDYEDDDQFYSSMAALSVDSQAPPVQNAGLPSGTREPDSKSNNTQSSQSNQFNQTTNNSGSTTTGKTKAERKKPTIYNMWDGNGQQHASLSSNATPATAKASSGRGPVRRGRWARASGQRRSAPEFVVTRPTGELNNIDSEDESDDGIRAGI